MAEAGRGLRIYLITDEQLSIIKEYMASEPDGPTQAAVDLIATQEIGMLPAADLGNQMQRQAQFEKYRATIAAAIGSVEPGIV
jgi:hypothetical protein